MYKLRRILALTLSMLLLVTTSPGVAFGGEADGVYEFAAALELLENVGLKDGVDPPVIYVMGGDGIPIMAMSLEDEYHLSDVAAVNRIISVNGLSATKDDPEKWGFATWNSALPKRLTGLDLNDEGLNGALDVSGCDFLTDLVCADNQLTTLNVSDCIGLTNLYCHDNPLSSLILSDADRLTIIPSAYGTVMLTGYEHSGRSTSFSVLQK